MARLEQNWLSRRVRARSARHWQSILGAARRSGRPVSDDTRDEARDLQQVLSTLLQSSEAMAVGARGSLSRMVLPAGTDWRWRPQILQGRNAISSLVAPASGEWLSPEVALFHDCPRRALMLRQRRNRRATDLAEYSLALEVMGFEGSYLSYSLGLPEQPLDGLGGQHVIRVDTVFDAERPIAAYARLNIQQGPNTETILRKLGDDLDQRDCRRAVEFDLGYADLSARRVDKAWVDVILEAPAMNAVAMRDIVLSRYPRAQM
ncbi:MAG: DUF6478 family protein [Paracoccus sp. (in: a-proteobacteria)]|uniref:DUF6478 family protein n=1 Tax=Paracoccus sp. TaxID=267 RepID=UPI00391B948A